MRSSYSMALLIRRAVVLARDGTLAGLASELNHGCPRTVEADFAMLIANCRARGSALSGVCLRVASQRPWARQVLTANGTTWSETISRAREAGKRLATSRSHKILTEPISLR